jgi:D-arabinose 1-dehydrogenase-like Zn-dependent alcohol dehydrogenase
MTDSPSHSLPRTYQAIVCREYGQASQLESLPMPEAVPGSAVVRIIAATCDHGARSALTQPRNPYFSNPTPFVPGNAAVGRVAAVGSDAVSLQPGQLVLLEPFVRGRDDPNAQILKGLYGGPNPAAQKLSQEVNWRNGTWAEYTRVPLENCYALDEKALLGSIVEGGNGYEIDDLPQLTKHLVAYGGLRAIDLKAGETIIVAPATGIFSGSAVQVASAMGARVIAIGRNADTLERLAASIPRVHPVRLTGDFNEDVATLKKFGTIDVVMDFTTRSLETPPYLKTAVAALRQYGRVVLTGYARGELSLSYGMLVMNNLTIRASYMYEREDVKGLLKLAESGLLPLGKKAGVRLLGRFKLEEWDKAIEFAEKEGGSWGDHVVFRPFDR